MFVFTIILFVVLGLLVGSFLNVCIDRLPAGQSLIRPPSHCSACGRRLGLLDLVPVFSYLLLRGRCRYCGAKLPLRLMLTELGTGILFGYLYWHFTQAGTLVLRNGGLTGGTPVLLGPELLLMLVYSSVFIVLSVIDLDHQLILNKISYPATVLALAASVFVSPSRLAAAGGVTPTFIPASLPQAGIVQAAIGAAAGLLVFLLIIILSRGGMGLGDAKMAAFVGAITGYLVPLAVFVAVIVGGLMAVALLVFKLKKRKEGIPFGPFLAVGGVVAVLWGNSIGNWYAGVFWG